MTPVELVAQIARFETSPTLNEWGDLQRMAHNITVQEIRNLIDRDVAKVSSVTMAGTGSKPQLTGNKVECIIIDDPLKLTRAQLATWVDAKIAKAWVKTSKSYIAHCTP